MENKEYIFLVYTGFFVSIVLFCVLINTILLKFSTTLGIRDKEKPMIRWSSVSKPALGGISFYISFLISTGTYGIFFNSQDLFNDGQIIGLICSVSLAFLMGLADDAYNTRPWLKFFVQFSCGVVIIIASNFSIQDKSMIIQIFDEPLLNYCLTIVWAVSYTHLKLPTKFVV